MRSLRFALAAASLVATAAFASPADPKNGAEYLTLPTAQPVQAVGKKVEVIEFFAYHCPACNLMEPHVEAWVKKQGENINFKRVHFPFQGPNDPEAHLYLTLEAMGKAVVAFFSKSTCEVLASTTKATPDFNAKGSGVE